MDINLVKLKSHSVKQGKLIEFLTAEDTVIHQKKFGHLFFVTFDNKKIVRGNHFHKKQHEYYIVLSGEVKVLLKDLKTEEEKIIILNSKKDGYKRLRIGPNIVHAACSITPKASLLAYYGDPYDSKNLDTYPYKLI